MSRDRNYRFTLRWMNRRNWYEDKSAARFVVYRRALGIERKTSIRYFEGSRKQALNFARREAMRLREWPARNLAKFRFKTRNEK